MSGQRTIGDVSVGDDVAPAIRNASRAQLFLYSAASHHPHRIIRRFDARSVREHNVSRHAATTGK